MSEITALLQRFEKVKTKRLEIESVLQSISDYVLVHKGDFNKTDSARVQTVNTYSNAAIEANSRLASTIYGGLTNIGSKWFALQLENAASPSIEVQRWLDQVNNIMLHYFNSSESGFASQNHEFLLSVTSLGTACMWVDSSEEDGSIHFSTIHLSEIFILEDNHGQIDTVFRKFKFTARQMAQMWGEEALSEKVTTVLKAAPDTEFELLHVVKPKGKGASSKLKAFKYESIYIDIANKHQLSVKGFYEMPYIVARFSKRTQETYGRSPAWDCLPTIKLVNQMEKEVLRAKQLRNMPPLLVADDGVMSPLKVAPNAIIMGGLSYDGSQRIAPLNIGGDPQGVDNDIARYTQAIRESFFVDQLYFKDGTPVTATEAVQRQEARLQMLTPAISRLTTEYLNKLIEVVFDTLYRRGDLPPIPQELDPNKINIEYLSPLAKLQKFQDIQALQRAVSVLAPLAQVDPTMFDVLNLSGSMRYAALAAGVPANLLRSEEEVAQMKAAKEQQAAIQQNLQLSAYANQLNKPVQ